MNNPLIFQRSGWPVALVFTALILGSISEAWPAELKPDAAEAQAGIVRAVELLKKNRVKEAAEELKTGLKSEDLYTRGAARFYAGHCLLRLKQPQEAMAMWARIEKPQGKGKPTTAVHWYYLARVEIAKQLMATGDLRQAVSVCRQVLGDGPVDASQAEAALILGNLAASQGEYENEVQFYKQGIVLLDELIELPEAPELTSEKSRLMERLREKIEARKKQETRVEAAEKREQTAKEADAKLSEPVREGNRRLEEARGLARIGREAAAVKAVERFLEIPNHPRWEEGRFLHGLYLLRAGERQEAFERFRQMIRTDPTGPYRGQARLAMADALLFDEFDVKGAKRELDDLAGAMAVLMEPDAAEKPALRLKPVIAEELSPLTPEQYKVLPPEYQRAYRDLRVRLGVLAWLEDNRPRAVEHLSQARGYLPPRLGRGEIFDEGLFAAQDIHERLIDALEGQRVGIKGHTLPVGNRRDSRLGVAILLAELAFAGGEFDRAKRILQAIVETAGKLDPTTDQRAYALLRIGQCHFRNFAYTEGYACYEKITSDRELSDSEWVPAALLRQAIVEFSIHKDRNKSLALLGKLSAGYPKSNEAPDAIYYKGVTLQWGGEPERAREVYGTALSLYPEHEGLRTVVSNRLEEIEQQERAKKAKTEKAKAAAVGVKGG